MELGILHGSTVLEQQQPLCATLLQLKRGDLMPTDLEFSVLEKYVNSHEAIGFH